MSPTLKDYRSPSSSSQPSYFQNPNPSFQKCHTDSGIFNTTFNPINFSVSELDFDCSKDAAAPPAARPPRRKLVKVKKHSVSSKRVDSREKTVDFVFNGGSVCNRSLGETVSGGDGESLDVNMLKFNMGSINDVKSAKRVDEMADTGRVSDSGGEKFGKPNGLEFVFGSSMNDGVVKPSLSNVGRENGSGGVGLRVDESESNGLTTEVDSFLASSISSLNLGTGEAVDVANLMKDSSKTPENNASDGKSSVNLDFVFSTDRTDVQTDVNYQKEESKETVDKPVSDGTGTSIEGLGKEGFRMGSSEINSGDGANGNVDSGTMFGDNKVYGSFHVGNENIKRSSCKGRRKFNKQMNNLKSEGAGSREYFKKQDDSNASSDIPQSKVPDESVPSSSSFSTNEAGITNNFSFTSNIGVFGTSFTGFNTPDINLASPFTSDMFSGLGKKLDFSKTNSVGQRKLKKTKTKLRQQVRNHQQGGRNLSKDVPQSFEESSGCSPMDFSPYGGTEGVSTSNNPATSKLKNEEAVDTTENISANNFSSSPATSFVEADASARQRSHRKKYIIKTGQGVKHATPKVSRAHESTSGKQTKDSDQEICDKWRKRGNQAYKKGDLSEAEVCYSKGISSIQHTETSAFCIEPLLLCYSNRAAARMALGRLREGLKDCRTAAALDPTFVKANVRSANCHLLLGELEDASYNYSKCLESENIVCLDRRLAIEAADGLQKAQKVASYLKQSAELLQQKTYESAMTALGIISDALSLSCYSEKLLNMKGEALCVLGKHKDVVQLCEQTLDAAEKNFATESKLWRWNLMSKSYFHLGRLDIALDFIEKHEQLRPTADKSVDPTESLTSLAVTIRELLHCKNAGNEAFQNGKHTEAIEHYSAAISKSMESHSFAAVCFCNRAAAHQSLGVIIDAIGDCSAAIALDGTYPKALSRRSTLWEMIRDYKHAADDLQRLVSILETPSGENSKKSNGSVKDLRKARRRLSSIEENSKKERSLDLYLILGIKPSDTAAEVKKAYRKAALRHHPDKAGQVIARAESGSDGQKWKLIMESIQIDADKLFKMIGEAYAVLSDSTKRSKYDLEEEMWDDMNTHACSSSRRGSDFYSSPYETSNRRNSYYSTKTYGNSHYHYWEDSRKNYHSSYPRW
ncbi:putative DnaJ domain, tetratricopeptide-like helical domain superfamily [Helianthus annuus]|nr:putative DnaJ domain, tetratricopeptide-like helical domain superfamily [Helianthus annuus]KAJ0598585.1 putative DnaJ domain, tetratricopeptide-like helical domain superfamily [Helianthus annuus]KAJ0762834.1 putative DnaJ domain, tetratricopeptide-like helical domain superfamily [Helianthus annuus]